MISSETLVKKNSILSAVYLGWLAVASFYFYQYILRVAPGVLVTDLRETFHLTAEQFSTLGAYYLYAYSLCQVPIGILVDYIGVRKTVIFSTLLCIAGIVLMVFTTHLLALQLSRILIGIGSACAFMCTVKIIVDYLPPGKRGLLMGATLTLGTLGALTAGAPLASLADHVGWREAMSYVAYCGIIILAVAYFFIPLPKKENLIPISHHSLRTIFYSLVKIFKTKPLMIYALLAIGVYTPLSVLADLWGVAFLIEKYDLTRTQAADISMMMYFGLGIGSLLLPWLAEKYKYLNRSIQFCTFAVLIIFCILLYGPTLSIWALKLFLTLLGIFCAVEMLCFAGASLYTHARNVGVTLGVVNTFNMLGGGLLQQLIGWILDQLWTGTIENNGVRFYDANQYTIALSVLFAVIFICCLLSMWLPKDTLEEKDEY